MFLSLNKKIILAIVIFFILCFGTFGYTLYSLYNSKLQEDQLVLHQKNIQYNELLYHYNKLKNETDTDSTHSYSAENAKTELLKQEDSRYKTLRQNLHLTIACLGIFSILIVLMIVFLHNMVLLPLTYFSEMNRTVLQGIYKKRLKLPAKLIKDEFDHLEQTYNRMLDNIEEQITQVNEQKEFLQNILNGIPDAIRVLNFDGTVILSNKTYRQNLEQCSALTGQPVKCHDSLLKRQHPCSVNSSDCPLLSLKKQKNVKFIQELPFGKKQYLSVNAARIDTAEQPLIIESFRDLSEDIRFSHQQKISSLGFLTTAIAHEIKNNLGSMRLILESIFLGKLPAAERRKYEKLLYEQLLECIKIPERLLKIAKAAPDELHSINCKESIEEICALLDYEAKHNGIVISLTAENDIPEVTGNETDFKMIILNLAQNAIKAMPSGGTLSIMLQPKRSHLNISVQDTGHGIPAKEIPHIFEPFFSRSADGTHTGLGLAIVKSLLHNFGGDIKVSSKIDRGTTFSLKIPYKNKK